MTAAKQTGNHRFIDWLLASPHLVMSVILLLAALGFIGFKAMPLNLFPDANYPVITVIIPDPGAAAADVEDKVTRTVEKELATIDLVRKVRSVSQDEMAAVSVEFEYAKSLDAAATDVANALKKIADRLPAGIREPEIFRVSDATNPVFTLALHPKAGGPLDLAKVRQLADNEIREAFLRLPEVAGVEVFGGYEPEITITIDPLRLHAHKLSLARVVMAIRKQNLNIPDGLILNDHGRYLVKTRGERLLKGSLAGIVVGHLATPGSREGGEIHLGDIATITTGYRERNSLFRGNGRAAIGLNLLRPEKGHVTTTMAAVEKALPEIKRAFPAIDFTIADTQKQIIETSIANMTDALRDAIIMTILVIFLILGNLRLSLLAAISIPFTYCLTFAVMYVLGYELNIVTLTAVIVAVGLLLDDAIVVIENIERHHRKLGKPLPRATLEGLKEIMLADWAGTYTTVIVLVPIMFIGGYVQQILRPFTVVLAISLLSSYIISVTVIPILAPHVIKSGGRRNPLEKLAAGFDRLVVEPIGGGFAGLVHFALRHRLFFIPPVIILFVVSMRFVMPLSGRDLMPPMDTGIIKVAFETEANSSLADSERAARRIEALLAGFKGLRMVSTMVGTEPGVVSFGTGRTPQQGLITAHFVDRFHRQKSIWEIEAEIREKSSALPGLRSVDVYDFGATPLSSIAATVDIMISGPDPMVLDRLASEVARRLEKCRGLTTINRSWSADKNEFLLDIDVDRAGRFGLDPESLSFELAAALKGTPASTLRVPGEDGYLIRVRYPAGERRSLSDLLDLYLPTPLGPVPLREVVTIVKGRTRTRFTRQDLGPVVNIYGYRATTPVTFIQANIDKALAGLEMPPGYRLSHEGEVKNMGEAGIRLARALGLAVILLYFSLVPTFRSWLNPITIMVAIPLAMIGGAWGLLISGQHACMPANMGMILLAGIVVNNSILLIDFIEQARARGAGLLEAVEEAVRTRTRPILMTAVSTIVGMLPIAAQRALGLERLSPLAVVAIGGLLVSTFLTLVYIPLFYTLVDRLRQKFSRRNRPSETRAGI